MPESVRTGGSISVHYTAEHRTGYCEGCGEMLVQDPKVPEEEKVRRNYCLTCDSYSKGVLISRAVSIQQPNSPACLMPKCLWKFIKDSILVSMIFAYHNRRVKYAETHRHKIMPMKYRTGLEAPLTIRQCIWANSKLILLGGM